MSGRHPASCLQEELAHYYLDREDGTLGYECIILPFAAISWQIEEGIRPLVGVRCVDPNAGRRLPGEGETFIGIDRSSVLGLIEYLHHYNLEHPDETNLWVDERIPLDYPE